MKIEEHNRYFSKAIELLKDLIAVPSFSNEEEKAANIWEQWLRLQDVKNLKRFHNNVFVLPQNYDPKKPVVLLNSHLDTVRPVDSYTRNPFLPEITDGKLYGLGSNDAGGPGVALAAAFLLNMHNTDLSFNPLLAITASEERMGELGMRAFLPHLKELGFYPDMAIVGEPTSCKAAIAERGLVVCDALVEGKAGHAARNEGINAIYRACEDIETIKKITWPKKSEVLGDIKASVTMIQSGTQHNVVPDKCTYVVDIRTTDAMSNQETVDYLNSVTKWSTLTPRSTRIQASVLERDNPLFKTAEYLGLETYVSPTTSDMALMHDIPSIKIGPGDSARSHTADEFIFLHEISQGIEIYNQFLNSLSLFIK